MGAKATQVDKVVVSLAKWVEHKDVYLTEWDITACCYESFPTNFGLRGYHEKYPNHKITMNLLMNSKHSKKGLLQSGYLTKVKQNHYRIEDECLIRAKELRIMFPELFDVGGNISSITSTTNFELLNKSYNSKLNVYRMKNGEISPRWGMTSTFLKIIMPPDQGGFGGTKVESDAVKKENQGSVQTLRRNICSALNEDSVTVGGSADESKKLTRTQILECAKTFNEVILKWGRILEKWGVKTEAIDIKGVEKNEK